MPPIKLPDNAHFGSRFQLKKTLWRIRHWNCEHLSGSSPPGQLPPQYYDHVRQPSQDSREALFARYATLAAQAKKEAWNAELGVTNNSEVDHRIEQALGLACGETLSKLNRMAFGLVIYASSSKLPMHDARLTSSRWSDATGRD